MYLFKKGLTKQLVSCSRLNPLRSCMPFKCNYLQCMHALELQTLTTPGIPVQPKGTAAVPQRMKECTSRPIRCRPNLTGRFVIVPLKYLDRNFEVAR